MGEPIQQRGGHLRVPEDLGPLPESQVGGDDQGGALVELRDQVKEQLSAVARERQIAEFIPGSLGRGARAAPRDVPPWPASFSCSRRFTRIHQIEEAHPGAAADGLPADGNGEVGLARAGACRRRSRSCAAPGRRPRTGSGGGALLGAGHSRRSCRGPWRRESGPARGD